MTKRKLHLCIFSEKTFAFGGNSSACQISSLFPIGQMHIESPLRQLEGIHRKDTYWSNVFAQRIAEGCQKQLR